MRTASALVRFLLGWDAFFTAPSVGINGNTGVVKFEARSTGCVVMGPMTLVIPDNSIQASLFKCPSEKPLESG
jgi:hypothetical protein